MSNKPLILSMGAAVIGLIIGGIIGHFLTPTVDQITNEQQEIIDFHQELLRDEGNSHTDFLLDQINTDNLRENLRQLTIKPHLAGSAQDDILAELFETRLKEAGFDWVEKVSYSVLLSKPDVQKPNKIELIKDGAVEHTSKDKEVPIHADDYDEDFIPAFNAYTPAGDVTSDKLVYANYGRVEDFEYLENELKIDVTDAVVICRYGKIFRGNKIDNAQKKNASAVIIYSDPEDVAADGVDAENVYDHTWWLPGSGMQRGTTFLGDGDPLTPGWPSTENAYRLDESEAELPKIPAQPIGYDDAVFLLKAMAGPAAPESWEGGLKDLAYNVGPEMQTGYTIRVVTNNFLQKTSSYNVIGVMKGDVEPDRYVLIGNHRDAWGYGAADPSSGTAQILETARVLGALKKTGWKPKRSIVFCSWGAEEYGLIGSYEWVEEHINKLQGRAVAYVNTDTCASGPILQAKASPLLWDLVQDVAKKVPGVLDNTSNLHEEWKSRDMILSPDAESHPVMSTLGSGSDYAPFIFYGGIPSLDIWFRRDRTVHNISTYPSYHTGYETFHMMAGIMDPEFKIHQGCGRVASLVLKQLADSKLLPLNIARFPEAMYEVVKGYDSNGNKDRLVNIYDNYPAFEQSVKNLKTEAESFMAYIRENEDNLKVNEVRSINDQLMSFEQNFIIPEGLPGRPMVRHAVFAPSQFDNYAAAGFPGITDLLFGYDDLTTAEKVEKDKEIRKHISDLTIIINRALGMLKNFETFN